MSKLGVLRDGTENSAEAAKTSQGLQKRLRKAGLADGWPSILEGKGEGWEGPDIRQKERCAAPNGGQAQG